MKKRLIPCVSLAFLAVLSYALFRMQPTAARVIIPLLPLLFAILFPFTRKNESLYVFVAVIAALAAPDFAFAHYLVTEWLLFGLNPAIVVILYTVMVFSMLLCAEEIAYLYITRIIFGKQKPVFKA